MAQARGAGASPTPSSASTSWASWQRTRYRIANRNVFGVDLNPVTLELAEVSLWLNGIHRDSHVLWFGYQLTCGNSLVDARRQTYPRGKLLKQRKTDLRFNSAPRTRAVAFGMMLCVESTAIPLPTERFV